MNKKSKKVEFLEKNQEFIKIVPDILTAGGRMYPTLPVVRYKDKDEEVVYSYQDLISDAESTANFLLKNIYTNKNIAIIGVLSYQWLVAYFGILRSGNVVVTIDKELGDQDIEVLIAKADVKYAFVDSDHSVISAIKKSGSSEVEFVDFQEISSICREIKNVEKDLSIIQIRENDNAMIVFTSGTTEVSKGVVLTHKNLCHNMFCCVDVIGDTVIEGENIVPVLPPHHMFQIMTGVLTPIYYGVCLCFGRSLKYISATIKTFQPKILIVVPMVIENLYNRIWIEAKKSGSEKKLLRALKISNILLKLRIDVRRRIFKEVLASFGGELEYIVCGGAYLNPDLVNKFYEIGIFLQNGYGITECSPVIACNRARQLKADSVGKWVMRKYCETKFENGEIYAKGSMIMKEYYKDKEATREAFYDGWFKTGDLGYEDEAGFVHISGRCKNLIILSDGNNISPEELEKDLEKIEFIKSVFVTGTDPDKRAILTAYVYPDYEVTHHLNTEYVKNQIQSQILCVNKLWPKYKQIKRIIFYEQDFEKSALGKVKRYKHV